MIYEKADYLTIPNFIKLRSFRIILIKIHNNYNAVFNKTQIINMIEVLLIDDEYTFPKR